MDDVLPEGVVLDALVQGLGAQGQGGRPGNDPARFTDYPIKGTVDLVALAEAIEIALRGGVQYDDGTAPADLNAANDG